MPRPLRLFLIDYATHPRNAVPHGHMRCAGGGRVAFADCNRLSGERCALVFAWKDRHALCRSLHALAGDYCRT